MKKISEHLGGIIASLAAVALLIAAITLFKAPIGDFFDNIIEKESNLGQNVLNTIETPTLETKKGIIVSLRDLSSTSELPVRLSSDTVTDFSTVTVFAFGKNLVFNDFSYLEKTYAGVTYTPNSDGSILVNGTATAYSAFPKSGPTHNIKTEIKLPAGTYTFSGGSSDNTAVIRYKFNKVIQGDTADFIDTASQPKTVTFDEDVSVTAITIYVRSGNTANGVLVKPQIELGEEATEFEPYITPVEYTPNSDGTITNLELIVPNMTLTSDNDEVFINCTVKKKMIS